MYNKLSRVASLVSNIPIGIVCIVSNIPIGMVVYIVSNIPIGSVLQHSMSVAQNIRNANIPQYANVSRNSLPVYVCMPRPLLFNMWLSTPALPDHNGLRHDE